MQSRRGHSSKPSAGRLAAIAPRADQHPQAADQGASLTSIADVPRTRLPPRSRSGCWTCRTRKVKCDEARPRCNQCNRLGHICDYSAKLAFKDETPKVVDKYLGPGSPIDQWDPAAELQASNEPSSPLEEDTLPPFTALTNDEDWQKKAEHRAPGTYYVVANASSFSDVEEYKPGRGTIASNSPARDSASEGSGRTPNANVSIDRDTLILGTFEDPPRKPGWNPTSTATRTNSTSTTSPSSPKFTSFTRGLDELKVSSPLAERYGRTESASPDLSERRLTFQYHSVIRRHILQSNRHPAITSTQISDAFEREAATFPPLHHALMALSALSIRGQSSVQNVHALQYYGQAIGHLKSLISRQELDASNGNFLTHFILLLYEIACTEQFWSNHMFAITRIISKRATSQATEPYPYVIWYLCQIDIIALLSGSGKGEFITYMLQHNLVPTSSQLRDCPGFLLEGPLFADDWDLLGPAINFYREILTHAASIGSLARQFRETAARHSGSLSQAQTMAWQQQATAFRELLSEAWRTHMPRIVAAGYQNSTLPFSVKDTFERAFLLYNTLIIYTSTSMYPTQAQNPPNLAHPISQILHIAEEAVQQQRLECRYMVFPLFIAGAGAATQSQDLPSTRDQMRSSLDLLRAFERERIGTNTEATRQLLESVFERAQEGSRYPGVDWVEVMHELCLQVVNYGL